MTRSVQPPTFVSAATRRPVLSSMLVLDAYDDLTRALESAQSLTRAYREWALAQPHRYAKTLSA